MKAAPITIIIMEMTRIQSIAMVPGRAGKNITPTAKANVPNNPISETNVFIRTKDATIIVTPVPNNPTEIIQLITSLGLTAEMQRRIPKTMIKIAFNKLLVFI